MKLGKLTFERGITDDVLLRPAGRAVFIEFKRLGKRPGVLQLKRHAELRDLGYIVLVIDDFEDFRVVVDNPYRTSGYSPCN